MAKKKSSKRPEARKRAEDAIERIKKTTEALRGQREEMAEELNAIAEIIEGAADELEKGL